MTTVAGQSTTTSSSELSPAADEAGGSHIPAARLDADLSVALHPAREEAEVPAKVARIRATESSSTAVIPGARVDAETLAAAGQPAAPGHHETQPTAIFLRLTDDVLESIERQDEPERKRRWRPSVDAVLVTVMTAIVLVLHGWNITGFPNASDDEGTYLAQAWAVQEGLGLAHYTYWYDHPPLAWIQLAGLSWLPSLLMPDGLAVPTGRISMLLVTAVIMLMVYVVARRLGFARWSAALALLLFGLSPLAVTMHRQIYLDSFAVAWLLAGMALALSPRKHLWHHMAAGACAAMAVLSKETMLVIVPVVFVALWQGTARNGVRTFSFAGFSGGLVMIGVLYPLYALLNGELFPGDDHVSLIGAIQFQLGQRSGSGNIFSDGSNSQVLLQSWLYYDSVLLLAGIAAAVAALGVRRLRAPALAVAILALVAMRPGGYLPAMYVIQVLPFLALCLAGLIEIVSNRVVGLPGELRFSTRWLPAGLPALWHRYAAAVASPVSRLIGTRGIDRLRVTALAGLFIAALVVVAPQWYDGNRRAIVSEENVRYVAAAKWAMSGIPDRVDSKVVVDDVLWLDLVKGGFTRENVMWFYKVDLDSAVSKTIPNGWRDIDYVISTPAMRSDTVTLPTVAAAIANSKVLATFGAGADRIEIRQVTKGDK